MRAETCVILCSAYPYSATGTAYAVRSILPVAVELFNKVEYVAVSAEDRSEQETGEWAACVNFRHVPANVSPKWLRFAKSLFSKWPATTQRYVNPSLPQTLRKCSEDHDGKPVLLVLDAPLYWPLLSDPLLGEKFSAVILWGQNVISDAFSGVIEGIGGLQRFSWLWEIERLRKYEKRVLGHADWVWSITDHDQGRFLELFDCTVDGVLGVSLDADRFETPIVGSQDSILYLGSFDIRKSLGITKFVTQVFPRLRENRRELSLWLGGKGSQDFDQIVEGVHGLGFVEDEMKFIERGLIFVNPQESGSGIKLKSLHALAAGKVLLTTPVGVQGIPGESGRDFLVAERVEEMADTLLKVFSDGTDLESIASNGRALAMRLYGGNGQLERARELFQEVLESLPRGSKSL